MAEGIITRRGGGGIPIVFATGGTITDIEQDGQLFRVHTFTSSGTFDVTRGGEVAYVVVGGGGGGFNGGGGGGYFTSDSLNLTPQIYSVVVGQGAPAVETSNDATAPDGETSFFGSIEALGGKGSFTADGNSIREGGDGGSGGGAGGSTNQPVGDGGFNGSDGGSGQRGSGGQGQGTPTSTTIRGTLEFFSGGGGGAHLGTTAPQGQGGLGGGGDGTRNDGEDGEPNTGGGGGGSGVAGGGALGGAGGSGIVIVRYRIG